MTIRILYKPEYKEQLIYLKKYLIYRITKDNAVHYVFNVHTVESIEDKKKFMAWLAKYNITDYSIIIKLDPYIATCYEDGCDIVKY